MESTLVPLTVNSQRVVGRRRKGCQRGALQPGSVQHVRSAPIGFGRKASSRCDFRDVATTRTHLKCISYVRDNDVPSCSNGYSYASCQLVLLPDSSYEELRINDFSPGWQDIASVVVHEKGDLTCPICLYPPFAPRMDRCGHIYCWPCALRYIWYDNESNTKKCAVCSWIVTMGEMKRVTFEKCTNIGVGDSLQMSLVKRPKSSSYIQKVDKPRDDPSLVRFQCFHRATPATMFKLQQVELDDLLNYKAISELDIDDQVTACVDYAINKINEESCKARKSVNNGTFSDNNTPDDTDEFYFYQASDGQPIYLDGLMWRCLLTEYREVPNLPNEFDAVVMSKKHCRMNSWMRKRLRYLNHLPDGYAFTLIEIELQPPLVSDATLAHFMLPLRHRESERARQQLEDLKLTELKKDAESCIPGLTPGFHFSGSSSFTKTQTTTYEINDDDFVPLTPSPNNLPQTGLITSFAEVTRTGARDIVGSNRVAKFSRSAPSRDFNPAQEHWPSLTSSKCVGPTSVCNQNRWKPTSHVLAGELGASNSDGSANSQFTSNHK